MLNFNPAHKSMNGKISKQDILQKVGSIALTGVLLLNVVFFSGCSKTVDCDISGLHAHVYVKDEGFSKYIVSEKEKNGGYDRTDDYIFITKEEKELIDFENKKGLYRIEENKEVIDSMIENCQDYVEYRYSYIYLLPIPHYYTVDGNTYFYYTYIPMTGYSWTSDPNHGGLTGEERVVHHMYVGYKIITNEKGKLEAVASEKVENIDDLPSDYQYVHSYFIEKVHLDNKNLEVDYEDGPEEDHQLSEEDQKAYEDQLANESATIIGPRIRKENE